LGTLADDDLKIESILRTLAPARTLLVSVPKRAIQRVGGANRRQERGEDGAGRG
jgi:hypothetical protein